MGNWLTIKHAAGDMLRNRFRLIEAAAFAWVPTITSVSRQAIFSGHPPMFFAATVQSTAAEERLWRSFWEDRGWRRDRIALIKHQANEHESAVAAAMADAIEMWLAREGTYVSSTALAVLLRRLTLSEETGDVTHSHSQ